MKAIIPLAGMGSRLRPHSQTQPKSLIPVAGKPILGHIMDSLVQAGVKECVFIVGYLGDRIESYISGHYPTVKSHYVIQTTSKGNGHAIWLAREQFAPDEPALIVLGDTIFEADLAGVIAEGKNALGVKKVEDPRLFGVAELDDSGRIRRVVEKPQIPHSNLALVGLYYIKDSRLLFHCLGHNIENQVRTQNEFHLTDGIQCMLAQGSDFNPFTVKTWFDCGKKDIILQTNRTLLKQRAAESYEALKSKGNIVVPPVYIHPSAQIENSIIGPDVSIGENAKIARSIVRNSIIGQQAELTHAILENSLLGADASLMGPVQSLNIGDSAEINLRDS
ncbi:MAG: sugar nucleotidyltransferase [Bacteroidia bacterium]